MKNNNTPRRTTNPDNTSSLKSSQNEFTTNAGRSGGHTDTSTLTLRTPLSLALLVLGGACTTKSVCRASSYSYLSPDSRPFTTSFRPCVINEGRNISVSRARSCPCTFSPTGTVSHSATNAPAFTSHSNKCGTPAVLARYGRTIERRIRPPLSSVNDDCSYSSNDAGSARLWLNHEKSSPFQLSPLSSVEVGS